MSGPGRLLFLAVWLLLISECMAGVTPVCSSFPFDVSLLPFTTITLSAFTPVLVPPPSCLSGILCAGSSPTLVMQSPISFTVSIPGDYLITIITTFAHVSTLFPSPVVSCNPTIAQQCTCSVSSFQSGSYRSTIIASSLLTGVQYNVRLTNNQGSVPGGSATISRSGVPSNSPQQQTSATIGVFTRVQLAYVIAGGIWTITLIIGFSVPCCPCTRDDNRVQNSARWLYGLAWFAMPCLDLGSIVLSWHSHRAQLPRKWSSPCGACCSGFLGAVEFLLILIAIPISGALDIWIMPYPFGTFQTFDSSSIFFYIPFWMLLLCIPVTYGALLGFGLPRIIITGAMIKNGPCCCGCPCANCCYDDLNMECSECHEEVPNDMTSGAYYLISSEKRFLCNSCAEKQKVTSKVAVLSPASPTNIVSSEMDRHAALQAANLAAYNSIHSTPISVFRCNTCSALSESEKCSNPNCPSNASLMCGICGLLCATPTSCPNPICLRNNAQPAYQQSMQSPSAPPLSPKEFNSSTSNNNFNNSNINNSNNSNYNNYNNNNNNNNNNSNNNNINNEMEMVNLSGSTSYSVAARNGASPGMEAVEPGPNRFTGAFKNMVGKVRDSATRLLSNSGDAGVNAGLLEMPDTPNEAPQWYDDASWQEEDSDFPSEPFPDFPKQ